VAWVLSKSAKVDYVEDDGFTALKAALQTEADWMHTSNPLARDADQAAELTIRLIDMLLAAGADVNQRQSLDEIPLHTAAAWSSPRVVQHLLAHGADPFAWNSDFTPQQPADVAKGARRWEVAAILRAAMGQTPAGLPLPGAAAGP
jgi:ankyrin repeat protein